MKQEDGKGIGDPVHKYYFFPSEACDFSRGYFTSDNEKTADRYCNGIFGVPITFFGIHNSKQFEIIGATESEGKGFSQGLWISESGVAQPLVESKRKYKRLFTRKIL